MILVNSGAFSSISSWFCELTELIFVMIPYISSTEKTQGIMGHVQVANTSKLNLVPRVSHLTAWTIGAWERVCSKLWPAFSRMAKKYRLYLLVKLKKISSIQVD